MQIACRTGITKNTVRIIVPPFIRKNYETTTTTVRIGVKITSPSVNVDTFTYTRSNHRTDWDHVIHYATTHISTKAGIKIFGTRGVDVV